MKIKVELEIELGELWNDAFDNQGEKSYFDNVIMNPKGLFLHSNEIGDTIGIVKSVKTEVLK